MININYTLNLLFNESCTFILKYHFGPKWYQNELLLAMQSDYVREPEENSILQDFILGKKNQNDLDVTVLSKYLLFNDKYNSLLSKTENDYLHILRKDRNVIVHEILNLNNNDIISIINNMVTVYNSFAAVPYTDKLTNNINALAGHYGITKVCKRTTHANSENYTSDYSNNHTYSYRAGSYNTQKPYNQQYNTVHSPRVANSFMNFIDIRIMELYNITNYAYIIAAIFTKRLDKYILYTILFLTIILLYIIVDIYLKKKRIIGKLTNFGILIKTLFLSVLIALNRFYENANSDILKISIISYTIFLVLLNHIERKTTKNVTRVKVKRQKKSNYNKNISKDAIEKTIYICPSCERKVRVDKLDRTVIIICPICKNEFIGKLV